jgi:hypothetical protein
MRILLVSTALLAFAAGAGAVPWPLAVLPVAIYRLSREVERARIRRRMRLEVALLAAAVNRAD